MSSIHTSGQSTARRLLGPGIVVALLALATQSVNFLIQAVTARLFGASVELDAFLAANTIPSYLITVILGSLGFVFVPVFVRYETEGRSDDAWKVAETIVTLLIITLVGLGLGATVFALPLTRALNPGLPASTLALSASLAGLTWSAAIATSLSTILAGLHQARRRFSLQAVAPFVGAIVTIGLLLFPGWCKDISDLALSYVIGAFIQLAVLAMTLARGSSFKFRLDLRQQGVREVLQLLTPLLIASLAYRWTPVVDRFVASQFGPGGISHLDYALKLASACVLIVSSGLGTVILPNLAQDVATSREDFRVTLTDGLRLSLMTAFPLTLIGIVISGPLVRALFLRGSFTDGDATVVSTILSVYLLAVTGSSFGTVTGRAFYALGRTRLIAILGVIQALAYAVYAVWFGRFFGLAGIALAYAAYYNVSAVIQYILLMKEAGLGSLGIWPSLIRLFSSAVIAAGSAALVTRLVDSDFAKIIVGGGVGLVVYGLLLLRMGKWEATVIRSCSRGVVGMLRSRAAEMTA